MTCKAKQYSDQMVCEVCDLTWDMNDPKPPVCGKEPELKIYTSEKEMLKDIIKQLEADKAMLVEMCEKMLPFFEREAIQAQMMVGMNSFTGMYLQLKELLEKVRG